MMNARLKAELARLDAEEALQNARYAAIKDIALVNARMALAQNQIEDYRDNVGDTIKEALPDASANEWEYAFDVYNNAVGEISQ